MKRFLREKIASNLFIEIDNPNLPNLTIIQDNETINRVVSPSPNLVLVNRITWFLTNEIQANCTIKGGPLGKMVWWTSIVHSLNWWQYQPIQMEKIKEHIFKGSF